MDHVPAHIPPKPRKPPPFLRLYGFPCANCGHPAGALLIDAHVVIHMDPALPHCHAEGT